MAEAVLDASAVLAALFGEPGGEIAATAAPTAVISAANFAEVIAKLIARGLPEDDAVEAARGTSMEVVAADEGQAELAARLHARTRALGVSMGDAFCLALSMTRALPAVTADRRWRELDIGVEVRLIR
ncbi:MAG: type II toxin-antitoxin system VapC family toxin [Caulobacteraceae bacterium]